jgi:XTP/dITP diphosphohydrolase
MKLIFASHNANKVLEIQNILGDRYELLSLKELSFHDDIPETAETLEGNSMLKADAVYQQFEMPCFADDTGLEVDSLGGAPGVYSARYAGTNKNAEDNMNLLLKQIEGHSNRKARFRTVITYKTSNQSHQFEGLIDGEIISDKRGQHGFGYDPIFIPNGASKTFGQMTMSEKNQYSHRSRAFEKLRVFLESQ